MAKPALTVQQQQSVRKDSRGRDYIEYPGIDGQVFRLRPGQQIPQLKEGDTARPRQCMDVCAKTFDMSNAKDVEEYADIYTNIAANRMAKSREVIHWCDFTQNFKIFLRWADVYTVVSTERQADNGHQQQRSFK